MSGIEESMTCGVHCVAASSLSSDQLTYTLFFSPSRAICREEKSRTSLSRRLAKLLRHEASRRGLPIGSDGYVCISSILALPEYHQFSVSDVLHVVNCDAKRRYSVRLDEAVVLNTRTVSSERGSVAVNEYTNSLSNGGNPLLAEEHVSAAKHKLSAEVPFITNAVCRDENSQVTKDNVLPAEPPLGAASVVGKAAKHREKTTRGSPTTVDAPEAASVVCRHAEWVCHPKRRFASTAHSTVKNSLCLQSGCGRTKSCNCCVTANRVKCDELDDGRRTTDATVEEESFISERTSVRFCFGSEGNLVNGWVDASRISICAVQGHSMSSVDSDKLLCRVTTWADILKNIPLRVSQNGAATVSFSGCCEPTCKCIPRALSASAGAGLTGICVVHGTYRRCWQSIQTKGLSRMSRNHIHFATRLPEDGELISGMRPNVEVLIFLNVERALAAGLHLYVSRNGVVLSPGNEHGIIECRFFERAIDKRVGRRLSINGKEEHGAADGQDRSRTENTAIDA